MLLTNCFRVHDAQAFLDAFAEAATASADWELESIKFDFGGQFVYVKYIGHEFRGQGLMASAFAAFNDPKVLRVMIRAEEWPTHLHWDESAKRLVTPLVEAAHQASRPKLRIVPSRAVVRSNAARRAGSK